MTLASEAIQRAYRESNLLLVGASPTTIQQTEALALLNSILLACVGGEAGEELTDLQIGGTYDQTPSDYVPVNARLVLNLAAATTVLLHPKPYDGQRVAVADAGNNLTTYDFVLNGNGRLIEGAATLTLSTTADNRQWLYRADLGDWKRITSLGASDSLPFPVEFDDYFIILLAMRLNPRHGRELAAASGAWLQATANRIEARYRKPRPQQDWGSLGLLGQCGTRDSRNLLQ